MVGLGVFGRFPFVRLVGKCEAVWLTELCRLIRLLRTRPTIEELWVGWMEQIKQISRD
jgi:hypothetical protein